MNIAELTLYSGIIGANGILEGPFEKSDQTSERKRSRYESAMRQAQDELRKAPVLILADGMLRYGQEALMTEKDGMVLHEALMLTSCDTTREIELVFAPGGVLMFNRVLVIPNAPHDVHTIITTHVDKLHLAMYGDNELNRASEPISRGGCGEPVTPREPYVPMSLGGEARDILLRKRLVIKS